MLMVTRFDMVKTYTRVRGKPRFYRTTVNDTACSHWWKP